VLCSLGLDGGTAGSRGTLELARGCFQSTLKPDFHQYQSLAWQSKNWKDLLMKDKNMFSYVHYNLQTNTKKYCKIKCLYTQESLNIVFFLEFSLHYQIAAYFLVPFDEFCQNKINIKISFELKKI